ncbi:hypothetical protein SAMN05216176_102156 [Nitratireductor indicus]|nr:hypothetical protein SAMN05216176_102156 [Nitratireductor indicus]
MANSAGNGAVLVLPDKFPGIGCRIGMLSAVRVAFHRDCGDGNHGPSRKPSFESVVLSLPFGKSQPPSIVVNGDRNTIRIVESNCRPVEGRLIEGPWRGGRLPNQLRERVGMFFAAKTTPLCGKVVLVSPQMFGAGGSGFPFPFLLPIR